MSPQDKYRHLKSAAITFISVFLGTLATSVPLVETWDSAALYSLLSSAGVTALRAAFKIFIEYFNTPES